MQLTQRKKVLQYNSLAKYICIILRNFKREGWREKTKLIVWLEKGTYNVSKKKLVTHNSASMATFNYSITKILKSFNHLSEWSESTFPRGTNSNQDIKLHFCSQNIPGSLPGTMYWITIICWLQILLRKNKTKTTAPPQRFKHWV